MKKAVEKSIKKEADEVSSEISLPSLSDDEEVPQPQKAKAPTKPIAGKRVEPEAEAEVAEAAEGAQEEVEKPAAPAKKPAVKPVKKEVKKVVAPAKKPAVVAKKVVKEPEEEDVELISAKPASKAAPKKAVEKVGPTKAKKDEVGSDLDISLSEDEEKPAAKKVVAKKPAVPAKKAPVAAKKPVESSPDESDTEAKKPAPKPVAKAPVKKVVPKKEESDVELSPEAEEKKPAAKPAPKPAAKVPVKKAPAPKKVPEPVAEVEAEAPVEESKPEPMEEVKAAEEPKVEQAAPAAQGQQEGEVELFVGGLPYAATDDQLREYFASFGEVASVKILQREGRSTGKGFVQFVNPADAAKAKEGANNQDFQGRTIAVRFSSEPAPEPSFGRRPGGFQQRGPSGNEGNTIFIGGLSYNSTKESVQEFFSQCGNISSVRVATDPEGNPRGFAHVEFDSQDAVKAALAMSGQFLDGRAIRVDTAGAKGEKPAGARPFGGAPRGNFGGFSRGPAGGFGSRGAPRGGSFRGGRGGFGGRGAPRGGIDAAKRKGTVQEFKGKKTKLE